MKLNTIVFTEESTWNTLNFLASTENVMFVDNSSHSKSKNRAFSESHALKTIHRSEDLLALFDYFRPKFTEFKVKLTEPKLPSKVYIERIDCYCLRNGIEPRKFFESVEGLLKTKFDMLEEQLSNLEKIKQNRMGLVERGAALQQLGAFVPRELLGLSAQNQSVVSDTQFNNPGQLSPRTGPGKMINFVFGFIETRFAMRFLQIVNRVGKEMVEVRMRNLQLPSEQHTGSEYNSKTMVLIIFLIGGDNYLRDKINGLLVNFGFTFMNEVLSLDIDGALEEVRSQLEESWAITEHTEESVGSICRAFADSTVLPNLSDFHTYQLVVKRENRFAKNLKFLRHKNGFNQLMFWTPEATLTTLRNRLDAIDPEEFGFAKPKILAEELIDNDPLKPPTLIDRNWATEVFQEMVNVYGIPGYREINPAVFMIVSFPFFFGLMFGDVMHGLLVFCTGFFLHSGFVFGQKELRKASTVLMIMGCFSVYCGFIYNQFFSIAFVTQVGCYDPKTMKAIGAPGCHSFGLDWVWSIAGNSVAYLNSFKMKFSIIVGVSQMLLGLTLKVCNAVFFGNYIDLVFEAIPQMLFMLCTFGYLCACIVIKWASVYVPGEDVPILSIFINFPSVKTALFGKPATQQGFQTALLVVAILCIVWMYFPKPVLKYFKHKGQVRYRESVSEPEVGNVVERSILSVS